MQWQVAPGNANLTRIDRDRLWWAHEQDVAGIEFSSRRGSAREQMPTTASGGKPGGLSKQSVRRDILQLTPLLTSLVHPTHTLHQHCPQLTKPLSNSNDVRRILHALLRQERLFDSTHAHESAEQVSRASLVVCTRCSCAAERLLTDDRAS